MKKELYEFKGKKVQFECEELTFENFLSCFIGAHNYVYGTPWHVSETWAVIDASDIPGAVRKRANRLPHIRHTIQQMINLGKNNTTKCGFEVDGVEYQLIGEVKNEMLYIIGVEEVVMPQTSPVKIQQQYMILPNSVVIVKDGSPVIVNEDHLNYHAIRSALQSGNQIDEKMLNPIKALDKFAHAGLTYENSEIKLDGTPFKYQLFDRLIEAIKSGDNAEPELKKMFAFVRRAVENTSGNITERIFDFAKCNSIEFTDDGMMICYKRIRSDWKDCYTGTIDNSVGQVVSMPRNLVDEDMNKNCSAGLHFCSKNYLKHYTGERVVRVLVDPADVVSLPRDYNDSKGRCCKYIVIEEVTEDFFAGKLS